MKRKEILFAFVFAATLSLNASTLVSMSNDTIINLSGGIIPPPGGWGGSGPHHAPANISLPTVVYDEGSLLFIGTGAASFTYEILDETDEICLSGELELIAEQEIPVSLSTLPVGTYTMILGIAGREYEGEFTIE